MTAGATTSLDGSCRTVGSLLEEARRRLLAARVESAVQEADWLIEHALGLSRLKLAIERDRVLSEHEVANVQRVISRRALREPLQYILGSQEFCGLEFEVNPAVLIPRPETELIVRELVCRIGREAHPLIVDVGTGSGCLAVTLARLFGTVMAIDRSASALETARRNARHHRVEDAITWLEGDLLAPLAERKLEGAVAALVSNPPYIRESEWATLQPEVRLFEPRLALVAGPLGTEFHERLIEQAYPFLMPGGLLVLELGQDQGAPVCRQVRKKAAYRAIELVRDEAGIERVLVAERAG